MLYYNTERFMCDYCYLCGELLLPGDNITENHVISKTLIKRNQPKVKGYKYMGRLYTHRKCNNQFGDETHAKKALELIEAIENPKRSSRFEMVSDIKILAIDSNYLKSFSRADLKYFHITDVRRKGYRDWANNKFINRIEPVNIYEKPWNIALSVLAKNAAAVLVKDYNVEASTRNWNILAILNYSEADDVDLSKYFGQSVKIDKDIKIYCKKFDNTIDYFFVYCYNQIVVYFYFAFETGYKNINLIKNEYNDQNLLLFQGTNLNDLKDFNWLAHDVQRIELP